MALINFDCPECGHNLEVDERGSGFIVKCPECANPLQIPELPKSHRVRKTLLAFSMLAMVVALFAANAHFWRRIHEQHADRETLEADFDAFRREAQLLAMRQDAEIERLRADHETAALAADDQLAQAALAAIEEIESLSRQLERATKAHLDASESARTALLREHMGRVVEAAKNSLPAPPSISDAGPGRGIQGRLIVFPILPGPDGQTLRENAEITGVDGDKISVRFVGGGATYALSELHPGVAAHLPVDRLLALPRRQWGAEVQRVHQLQTARRDERIAELRHAIEALLPAE